MKINKIAIMVLGMLLAACGGGSDSSSEVPADLPTAPPASLPAPARAPAPQGVYNGDTSFTLQFNSTLVVLETGEAWYFGTRNWGYGQFAYQGTGPGRTPGTDAAIYRAGAFQMAGTDLAVPPLPLTRLAQQFEYSVSAGVPVVALTAPNTEPAYMTRITENRYVYERPARIETLAGAWTGTSAASGGAVTWAVQGSTITAPESLITAGGGKTLCAASGTVQPRPSGRNVFDVQMRLTGASCSAAGLALRGAAVSYGAHPFLGSGQVLDIGLRSEDGAVLASVRLGRPYSDGPEGVYLGKAPGEAADSTVAVVLPTGEAWVAGASTGVRHGTAGAPLSLTAGDLQPLAFQRVRSDRLVFNRPAVADDVAGSWNSAGEPERGGIWSAEATALSAKRALILYRTAGSSEQRTYCDVSGTLGVHPSGTGILAVQMRFSGAGCALAQQSQQGVGVSYFAALPAQPGTSALVDTSRVFFDLMTMQADAGASARVRLVRP